MGKYYTKTGDDGYTSLLGEGRVPKYSPQTEAVGAVDEASAAFGMVRAICKDNQTEKLILVVQRDLYHLMAEAAATKENAQRFRKIDATRVIWLEEQTDHITELVNLPENFILPGDSVAGAAISFARAVVRRAERQIAFLIHENMVENIELLRYLNRLSSLCFVLELLENQAEGKKTPTLAKQP
jgi:cob(I)alamin adenosyltransferase